MAKKENLRDLLEKHLGKEIASTLSGKIDDMLKEGKTSSEIEKTISSDLANHIEKEIVSTVIAKIGPIQPIKIKPIQSEIKVSIKPISVSPKINTSVSVKTGPGTYNKGGNP